MHARWFFGSSYLVVNYIYIHIIMIYTIRIFNMKTKERLLIDKDVFFGTWGPILASGSLVVFFGMAISRFLLAKVLRCRPLARCGFLYLSNYSCLASANIQPATVGMVSDRIHLTNCCNLKQSHFNIDYEYCYFTQHGSFIFL